VFLNEDFIEYHENFIIYINFRMAFDDWKFISSENHRFSELKSVRKIKREIITDT
jgi:hypothetical protein